MHNNPRYSNLLQGIVPNCLFSSPNYSAGRWGGVGWLGFPWYSIKGGWMMLDVYHNFCLACGQLRNHLECACHQLWSTVWNMTTSSFHCWYTKSGQPVDMSNLSQVTSVLTILIGAVFWGYINVGKLIFWKEGKLIFWKEVIPICQRMAHIHIAAHSSYILLYAGSFCQWPPTKNMIGKLVENYQLLVSLAPSPAMTCWEVFRIF